MHNDELDYKVYVDGKEIGLGTYHIEFDLEEGAEPLNIPHETTITLDDFDGIEELYSSAEKEELKQVLRLALEMLEG